MNEASTLLKTDQDEEELCSSLVRKIEALSDAMKIDANSWAASLSLEPEIPANRFPVVTLTFNIGRDHFTKQAFIDLLKEKNMFSLQDVGRISQHTDQFLVVYYPANCYEPAKPVLRELSSGKSSYA